MAKNKLVSAGVGAFLDSVAELFAEQSNGGWKKATDFKLLSRQIVAFLERCSAVGVTNAKATHDFRLPNESAPSTSLKRPPTWLKISPNDKQQLEKTVKAKSFVSVLHQILRHQEQALQMALNTEFTSPSPESKSSKRHRGKKVDSEEDDYQAPQTKKAKVRETAQDISRATQKHLKVAPKKNDGVQGTAEKKKNDNNKKRQTTLKLKVKKNLGNNSKNDTKQSNIQKAANSDDNKIEGSPVPAECNAVASPHQVFGKPSVSSAGGETEGIQSTDFSPAFPSFPQPPVHETSNDDFARAFEEFQAEESLHNHHGSKFSKAGEPKEPTAAGNGSVTADSGGAVKHGETNYPLVPSSQPLDQTLTLRQPVVQAADSSKVEVKKRNHLSLDPINDDSDMDTDGESGDESQGGTPTTTTTTTSANRSTISEATDFWISAPKTVRSRVASLIQEDDVLSRPQIETPLHRLRASLEVYKSRISHIPAKTWHQYKKKLEKFVQDSKFPSMSFMERFGRFRRLVFLDEEFEAMRTEDWERTRKAAKLCGLLAEVTAPVGEDAKRLSEREVSINIRDINWLEKAIGTKRTVDTAECGDAMEGVELSGALQVADL